MLIEIFIPSYHRPEKLLRCLKSVIGIRSHRVNIIVDYDNLEQEIKRRYTVEAVNDYFKNTKADIVMPLTDDCEIHDDTLYKALDYYYQSFSDFSGVIELNQENVKDGGCGFFLIGKKFYSSFNKGFLCPDYNHFYADLELRLYAQKINKYKRCMDARLIHYKPNSSNEPPDYTFLSLRENIKEKDIATWKERQKRGYLWGESFELVNV